MVSTLLVQAGILMLSPFWRWAKHDLSWEARHSVGRRTEKSFTAATFSRIYLPLRETVAGLGEIKTLQVTS
jgi:hypothetical protein